MSVQKKREKLQTDETVIEFLHDITIISKILPIISGSSWVSNDIYIGIFSKFTFSWLFILLFSELLTRTTMYKIEYGALVSIVYWQISHFLTIHLVITNLVQLFDQSLILLSTLPLIVLESCQGWRTSKPSHCILRLS